MEEIINILLRQCIAAFVTGVCGYLVAERKAIKKEAARQEYRAKLYSEALICVLRNTIQQACQNGINRGWVDINEQSNIRSCHTVYEKIINFEGMSNGETTNYIEKFEKLPNNPPQNKGVYYE